MSGLFGTLGVAGRGMAVVQNGIRTTGHNIANANTPGYSRQVQRVSSAFPVATARGSLGTGVDQTGIERITDDFVTRQILAEESSGGAVSTESAALNAVEEVFNEQQGSGLGSTLAGLYSSFSNLSTAVAPGAAVERQEVVSAAQLFVDTARRNDAELRAHQGAADRSIQTKVGEVNVLLDRVAELNAQIMRRGSLAPPNDLMDARDQALRELAREVSIQIFERDNGAVTVTLETGQALVDRDRAFQLTTRPDPTSPFNPAFVRVYHSQATTEFDLTGELTGGELGGLLRVRDQIIPDAIRSLDVLAYNAVTSINAVHQAGFDSTGGTGNDFFVALGAVEDAARDLAIEPGLLVDPGLIAAGALSGAPGDNGNALDLAALRDAPVALSLPGDPPGPPSGPTRSLLDHVAVMVGEIGGEARVLRDASEQHVQVLEVLDNRRDELVGVSIDEEVTNLVRLEAAFQANARMISSVERLLQDVLDIL